LIYHTVFDITTAAFKNWNAPAGAVLFIAIAIIVLSRRSHFRGYARHPLAFCLTCYACIAMTVLLTAVYCYFTITEYKRVRSTFDKGRFTVVEGIVTDFIPETDATKKESFRVRDTYFSYSTWLDSPGFNASNRVGGPIQEGLPVRISYIDVQGCCYGKVILKLEVGQ